MAEKRMFSRAVVCSDAFLDMPSEAQCLYYQLNMAADDRGFCDCPRRVMRMLGASDDSMKLLIAKKFVLIPVCNDQVIVIKHWRINNNMRTQRFKETKYTDILNELFYDENNSYSQNPGDGHIPCLPCSDVDLLPPGRPNDNQRLTSGRPNDNQRSTQSRVEENRVDKSRVVESRGEENNTIPSTTQKERIEGEYEGAAPDSSDLSTEKGFPSFSQGRNEDNRAYWRRLVSSYKRLGFDPAGLYELAAADGITRDDIDKEVIIP